MNLLQTKNILQVSMRSLLIVSAALFFVFLLTPDPAYAQGFVPCEGSGCSACHLIQMGNSILVWLIGVLFVVFAVIAAIAGFGLVTSGGNPAAKQAAKDKMMNAVIGLIIVLAAWVLVDTIMRTLLKGDDGQVGGFGVWSSIECAGQASAEDSSGGPIAPVPGMDCSDDAAMITRFSGSSVGVEHSDLTTLKNCYLADSEISAGLDHSQIYTTDRSHPRCSLTNGNRACETCSHSTNSCHYGRGSGQGAMAVDFNSSGISEADLNTLINARQSTCGGRVIFESGHTHVSLDSC